MAREKLSQLLDSEVSDFLYLSAGQIGDIYQARLHGEPVVIKTTAEERDDLLIEARMLQDLREEGLRVPHVIASAREALVLEYIEPCNNPAYERESEAAKALASLHRVTNDSRMYGYYYNTTIASFTQNNEQTQYNWGLFLSQMRILPMAKWCYERGVLERSLLERLEALCSGLYRRIDMSRITPSLLHGDLWNGNLLYEKNGPCFIDPAIYFGDREMELAFILLFHTFGERFFKEYTALHPLSEDFYETKVALYQIYPLLVHIALYGGGYTGELKLRLERLKV
ncbi:MAG: fructosamine kinase family protein [Campylobacterales bacterium]|nr:fructosamine kinase family protein [Campylobacterales bacterium]